MIRELDFNLDMLMDIKYYTRSVPVHIIMMIKIKSPERDISYHFLIFAPFLCFVAEADLIFSEAWMKIWLMAWLEGRAQASHG